MKQALITGASRGIGRAVAQEFQRRGYAVLTPAREELDLCADQSIREFLRRHADTAFDVVVNNAGVNLPGRVEELEDWQLEQTLQVNVAAPLKLLRGLIPAMKRAGGGRIVNIGSMLGVGISREGRAAYTASKRAIHGVTITLALELAPFGILVNTLCPGNTMTDLMRANNTPETIQRLQENIPLGRLAQPEEMARAAYFLGSEENSYITGQQLVVDGGYTCQ